MRVFWERVGVLGPVYRLAGRGLSDRDIAKQLDLAEVNVQRCVAWILRFMQFTNRSELVQYASTATGQLGLGALRAPSEPVLR